MEITSYAQIQAFLNERQSAVKGRLTPPIPSDGQLYEFAQAAMAAPDHGAICPQRFFILHETGQERLADLYEAQLLMKKPDAALDDIQQARLKATRAPLLVIIAAKLTQNHPKVPVIEQVIAASMAGYGFMLSLHAAGYGARLITGEVAHSDSLKTMIGLDPADQIIGILQIGSLDETAAPPPKKQRKPASKAIALWP
ncbi:MAG: nitroreductase [Alphaproteobacteria bacterium]